MGVHDGYLDRMTARLADLERQLQVGALAQLEAGQRRSLEASLAAARERLQNLRRAGAEVTDEMLQSFTQRFERLRAAFGEAGARAA